MSTFDGLKRHCTKFDKAKGGVLRCARFAKGKGRPVCDGRLVDGGRSPGLIRGGLCKRGGAKKKTTHARRRKHRA